jgi:hypothetical protein
MSDHKNAGTYPCFGFIYSNADCLYWRGIYSVHSMSSMIYEFENLEKYQRDDSEILTFVNYFQVINRSWIINCHETPWTFENDKKNKV